MAPTKSLLAALTYASVLVCALWTISVHLDASGGAKLLEATCPPSTEQIFGQTYGTGIRGIDSLLCRIVMFFKASFERSLQDFTTIFLLAVPSVLFIVLLESARTDRPYVGSLALIFGLAMQLLSAAVGITLFWALFVVQAMWGGTRQGKRSVPRADVEAALLAVLFGYLIPTAWMLTTRSTWSIVLWQPFPLYMSIVQNFWAFYRRSDAPRAGFDLMQVGLLIFAFIGTTTWFGLLWSKLSTDAPFDVYRWAPSWSIPDPQATTISSAVLHLLQYDMFWTFFSTILAGGFLFNSIRNVVVVIQIAPALIALCGPAALVSGIWLAREYKLVEQEELAKEKRLKAE